MLCLLKGYPRGHRDPRSKTQLPPKGVNSSILATVRINSLVYREFKNEPEYMANA